jgi:hypothetical protein
MRHHIADSWLGESLLVKRRMGRISVAISVEVGFIIKGR